MSQTFSLVCHDTKQMLWIGQGRDEVMTRFYSGEAETMSRLGRFLEATQGKALVVVCDDTVGFDLEYQRFEEAE